MIMLLVVNDKLWLMLLILKQRMVTLMHHDQLRSNQLRFGSSDAVRLVAQGDASRHTLQLSPRCDRFLDALVDQPKTTTVIPGCNLASSHQAKSRKRSSELRVHPHGVEDRPCERRGTVRLKSGPILWHNLSQRGWKCMKHGFPKWS